MKWIAVVLIGCAALSAVARTFPDFPELHARTDEVSASARANLAALAAADLAYREYARADSLLPLLPARPGIVKGLSPALPVQARVTLDSILSRELAAIARPRARIGVFLIDHDYGGHEGMEQRLNPAARQIYVGADSAGVYCAMVGTGGISDGGAMGIDAFRNVREQRRAAVLGPCTFFARYGAPGARMTEWLNNGGYALAEVPGPEWPVAIPAGSSVFEGTRHIRACIAGRDEACDRIVSFPPRTRIPETGAATARLGSVFMHRGNMSRMLLSEMEASFGAERFERFWTSDDEVPVAFASAFGVSITEWVREWGESHYGNQRLGAGVDAVSMLLSLLALAIAGGIAAAVAAHRRV